MVAFFELFVANVIRLLPDSFGDRNIFFFLQVAIITGDIHKQNIGLTSVANS